MSYIPISRQALVGALSSMLQALHRHIIPILIGLWLVQVVLVVWFVKCMQENLVETSATQGADLQADMLAEFRSLYTTEVVERVRPHGIDVSHDFRTKERAIPLPATFTIQLGRNLAKSESGLNIQLFSDYPFPTRTDGGPRDDFDRQALAFLRKNPAQPYYRFEDNEGVPVLRYAVADVMRKDCVACHNSHPASPKTDWKEGDVRGVLAITRPLAPVIAQTRAELRGTFYGLGILTLLSLAGLGLVVGKLRATSAQLEMRVEERTAALQEAHENLHAAALQAAADQAQANRVLAESEAFARLLLESTAEAIYGIDLQGNCTFANPSCARTFGCAAPADLIGKHMHELMHHKRADGSPYPQEECRIYQAFRQGQGTHVDDEVFWREDGTSFPVEYWSYPMRHEGRLVGSVVTFLDISERRKLENHLRQAQKLEAIGQLAGGVAHDFNNLLTVINGYAEMLLMQTPATNPTAMLLREIKKAGDRAAEVTRQLLAFSRKQVLQPRVIDLNHLLGETEKMLRRLIGENVELTTKKGTDLWPVLVDSGQINQVLMNLAINARDAMPQGGKLLVETANLEVANGYSARHPDIQPGPYVVLTVTDTGCGMAKAILGRIFEPFFSTKDDKGTGLGLAVVFGIVAQSGGHIHVTSEPGLGTTFTILLPRHKDGRPSMPRPSTALTMPRGTETILLAEDETEVRQYAARVLTECGYRVLPACDGVDALEKAAAYQERIDLLITDVVMPRMSGRQLADRLSGARVGLRVLFVSGYTANIIAEQGILEAGIALLPKPYAPAGLALKVREMLDVGEVVRA